MIRNDTKARRACNPWRQPSVGRNMRPVLLFLLGSISVFAQPFSAGIKGGEIVNARAFWIADDPYKRTPYPDPKIEKLRNWFCYKDYSGDFVVEQDCHNFDDLHWFLNARPIRAVGMSGRKVRTTMEICDNLSVIFEFPNGIHVNYEANQISPPGFRKVGEEFTGTKGVMETSRLRMVHHKSAKDIETIPTPRDITYDGIEAFLMRIETGKAEIGRAS